MISRMKQLSMLLWQLESCKNVYRAKLFFLHLSVPIWTLQINWLSFSYAQELHFWHEWYHWPLCQRSLNGCICLKCARPRSGSENCRTNWQSSNQLKNRHHFSCLATTFYFSESVRLTARLRLWQNAMADFCRGDFAVWEAPASLKQCMEVILSVELKQVTVKFWSQYLQYLQSYLEIFIRHLAAAVPLLESDKWSTAWRDDGPLCAPHCPFVNFIWCRAT